MDSLDSLERKLGYRFTDRSLLTRALTHRSAGNVNNERLEFLGDAGLGFVIAQWLTQRFPDASEHALTLMRASLVKRPSLAQLAREIDLGEYLRLGLGERRSGGHHRESILADAIEALIGAALEDGGHEALRSVVQTLFAARIATIDPQLARDNKTRLQEWVQARRLPPPTYRVAERSGDEHAPAFDVECRIDGLGIVTQGRGGSRRDAEQAAARAALERLEPTDGR
ncbi:MAG TPA: ribonuclease III [Pseudomonadales bacterium]|nr:ribonuclease III [Pseudomonadales bacterium]